MDDFFDFVYEFVLPVLLILATIFAILFGILSIGEGVSHDDCHDKGELIWQQVTYRKWDGCYVKYQDKWMPLETWQYNRNNGIIK